MSAPKRPVVTTENLAESQELDRILESTGVRAPRKIDSVVIGHLASLDANGCAWVRASGIEEGEPQLARSTTTFSERQIGSEVALMFEGGDPRKPIAIGIVQNVSDGREGDREPDVSDLPISYEDGRLVLEAESEIVLRCGRASITLTRAGKILARGAYLLSRSSGPNRIKGGSVQIN